MAAVEGASPMLFKESQLSLSEVEDRITNLPKPPPLRDLNHFKNIVGLQSGGTNPHRIQVGKQITKDMLTASFGPRRSRSGYHYLEITNADVRRIVNRLWPLCYSKSTMPQNKLIGKELCLGVLAEHLLEWKIDWAAYTVETNTT
jgi:hypothetical protein